MDKSFDRWLSSPSAEEPSSFFIISDSEDEFTEINESGIIMVPSSASSGSETPTR